MLYGATIAGLPEKVRKKALAVLEAADAPERWRQPVMALRDDDHDVRWRVAWALGEIDGERAAEALIREEEKGNMEVVAAAFRFFLRRVRPGAETTLVRAFAKLAEVRPEHGAYDWWEEMLTAFHRSGNAVLEQTTLEALLRPGCHFCSIYETSLPDLEEPSRGRPTPLAIPSVPR